MANHRVRAALGVAAALAGVAAVVGLVYLPVWMHRFDAPPPSLTKKPEQVVIADVPDATLVGRHNGQRIWQIHARRILAAADGQTTTFVGVDRGTLYRAGAPAARVAAGRAVYNEGRRHLAVSGGLRLSAGGLTLRTPRLDWSAVSGRVACPDPLTVTWDGGVATAESLSADTSLRQLTGRRVQMAARLEGEMFDRVAKRLGAATGASLALLLAPAATGAAPPAASAPVHYREVRVTGDVWRYNQATRTHVYQGHIVATHGDTTLHADRIAYDESGNTATVTGHITVDNPRNHVEGDSATVDFNTKTIHLRGTDGVTIIARPKPGASADAKSLAARIKDPVTLRCRAITYNYRDKSATAEGPVTVTHKQQVVTGDAATYAGADDLITVTGNVHGKDEKDQTFDAPSVKVSVKEGAEWMEAPNVRATFYVKEEPETAQAGTGQ